MSFMITSLFLISLNILCGLYKKCLVALNLVARMSCVKCITNIGKAVIFTTGVPRNFYSLETVPPCKKVWEPLI